MNPGSVRLQAYDDLHPHPHVIESGSPDARYSIVEKISNSWVVNLITVPYPHMSMALLVRDRKRDDRARALRTALRRDCLVAQLEQSSKP